MNDPLVWIPNGIVLSFAAAMLFPAALVARAAFDLVAVRRAIKNRRVRRHG